MINSLKNTSVQTRYMVYFIFLLIIPALFLNLGLLPFILDEATRANVALEMYYSGNYIVPTINGEFYYNKPPLFNWIQVLFVNVTGNNGEFVFRLPTVISLLFFSITIYLTQKKEAGRQVAFFSALAFLTCGRILLYDSFRGLIDISFSWVNYLLFWYIYSYGKRKEYFNLFMVAYLLGTIGFMMKGLPALAFLGISLLVYFIYQGEFKKLFSLEHLAGFALLAFILGAYLFAYSRYNSLDNYFQTLWSESSKRTFIDNSLWDSIKHLFIFPLDFFYHFLPWTLFLLIFLFKSARKILFQDDFSKFSFLILLFNILVYWVSPAIYPRYLFMFLPLLFYMVFYSWTESGISEKLEPYTSKILWFFTFLLFILILSIPLIAEKEIYDHFFLRYFIAVLLALPVMYLATFSRVNRILVFVGILLVSRIAFNWFVLPDRIENGTDLYQKNGALVAAELSAQEPLYILGDTRIHHVSTYYIMKTRKQVLRRWEGEPRINQLYIVEKNELDRLPGHELIFTFETRIEALKLCLVRFVP